MHLLVVTTEKFPIVLIESMNRVYEKSQKMLLLSYSMQHFTRLWPYARHQAMDEDEQGEKSHFELMVLHILTLKFSLSLIKSVKKVRICCRCSVVGNIALDSGHMSDIDKE